MQRFPKAGGLEILKRLKRDRKRPYVIAVSSKGFDPTVAEFFMLANERLKKPIPAADIEQAINRAYVAAFSVASAACRIDETIGSGNPKNATAKKNIAHILAFLAGENTADRLKTHLEKSLGRDQIDHIISDLEIIRLEHK